MAFVPSRNLFKNDNTSLRDWQHAARASTSDQFALSPKFKFTYHIVFGLNRSALSDPSLYQIHKNEISLLVKSVDLPSFDIKTETLNQYNRKKIIQTTHVYKPIQILFHDDNLGVINNLWNNYYSYYYADPYSSAVPGAYKRNAMRNFNHTPSFYGLDNGSTTPFFTYIKMYQMARREYVLYTLQNPIISEWNHNKLSYSDVNTHDNMMKIEYEAVSYDYGVVNSNEDVPEGFAKERYDLVPSPLSGVPLEGGTSSSFNNSTQIKNNAASILGSVIESINSYQNTTNISQTPNQNIINLTNTNQSTNTISSISFPTAVNTVTNIIAIPKTF